ncbi:MAG TPA: hypothetical protein VK427_27935 [Kofleriaceae bacterium]|nr:hypothetical protein [Kofleriaceae bacterium]
MYRYAVTVIVMSGCGRVGFSPRENVDLAGADASSVDAPVDARTASCPGASGPHADEDRDLVGNACDRCPHVADAAQADADGDGVGDVCDPEPTIPRQRIAFFDGFDDGVRVEWFQPEPLVDGRMRIDRRSGTAAIGLGSSTARSYVEVAGEILQVAAPAAQPQLLLGVDSRAQGFYYVEIIDFGDGRRRSLLRQSSDGQYFQYGGQMDGSAITPGAVLLALDLRPPDMISARIDHLTPLSLASPASLPATAVSWAIFVRGLDVALDYAIQIDTQ